MSLQKVSVSSVIFKQYFYKLKAYVSLLNGLIILQILALLISLGGVSSMSTSSGEMNFSVKYYSANIAIGLTFIWTFFAGIILTTKPYKNLDFTLVTNRVSNNLSNIGLLLTVSIYGGIITGLFNVLLRIVIYLAFDKSQIVMNGFYPVYTDLFLSIAISGMYMFLIAAGGYFIGVLTQINMIFTVIIPVALLGLARVNNAFFIFDLFTSEIPLAVFVFKSISISIVLFGLSILLSNRMEVRK